MTVSGGVHNEGPKLFLYHQVTEGDVLNWDYVGPFLEVGLNESWSEWSGSKPPRLKRQTSIPTTLTITSLRQTTVSTCK